MEQGKVGSGHLYCGLCQQEIAQWEVIKGPGEAICFRSSESTYMPASHSQSGFRESLYLWAFLPMSKSTFSISSPLWTLCAGSLLCPCSHQLQHPRPPFHGAAQAHLGARGTGEVTESHWRTTFLRTLGTVTGLGEESEVLVPGSWPAPDTS